MRRSPVAASRPAAQAGPATERRIQHEIRLALGAIDWCVIWRNNVGTGERFNERDAQVRTHHYGLPRGSSDLVGIVTTSAGIGRLFCVEVKRPGEKPREDQQAWKQLVNRFGGYACVATSATEAVEHANAARAGARLP